MVQVKVMKALTARNDEIAENIRKHLLNVGLHSLNILSSPGSGKTTLIEATIKHFFPPHHFGVIVGDLFTQKDGDRLEKAGARTFQLNTEGSCHLTAQMIEAALTEFDLKELDLLFIENIGNLVCPSVWDLGENSKVTLLSVAEGSDKVAKYRTAFYLADAVVVTKLDLLPWCNFQLEEVRKELEKLNPRAEFFAISALTGEGMEQWYSFCQKRIKARKE